MMPRHIDKLSPGRTERTALLKEFEPVRRKQIGIETGIGLSESNSSWGLLEKGACDVADLGLVGELCEEASGGIERWPFENS